MLDEGGRVLRVLWIKGDSDATSGMDFLPGKMKGLGQGLVDALRSVGNLGGVGEVGHAY